MIAFLYRAERLSNMAGSYRQHPSILTRMNAPDEQHEWVSVSEASRRFGLSPSEVRRRIRVGTLQGERHPRGPGDTRDRFMVQVPVDAQTTPNDAQPRADSEVLFRTLDALERARNALDDQAREIADLREERGRLTVERDNAIVERDRARKFQKNALDRSQEGFERWMEQLTEASLERQRAVDALARADRAERELAESRRRWWHRILWER